MHQKYSLNYRLYWEVVPWLFVYFILIGLIDPVLYLMFIFLQLKYTFDKS